MFNNLHFPASFTPRSFKPGVVAIEDRFERRRWMNWRGAATASISLTVGRLCAASAANGLIKAAATPRHMEAYAIGR